MQYGHAIWIADVPHGEELAFPWLFPHGVNGLSADRSKRYVDARGHITYLMFACNYIEQQRVSSEIGIKCMYVRVITRMINSLPMTCSVKKFDHNVICL